VASSTPATRPLTPDITDTKRLSDGANKLIAAMNRPSRSFHFYFKGRENLNEDRTKPPHVGPVALSANVSPQEITLTETRGSSTKTSKAKRSDETNWDMANMTTLGVMTNPNLVIAMGSTVASPPSTDMVEGTLADKFSFDTTAVTPAQKMRLEAARLVLSTIKDCTGTAWIAIDSGLLIKFNIDADYADKDDHTWKEHYEGVVLPK